MSDDQKKPEPEHPPDDEPLENLNLTLAYSLIALAIFIAIAVAVFIVLPFYHRH
jgi:hypothetical protein